ncbi:FAD:protein FMN transferase [Rhizomonospora bruguierae]|uniref:FAD:protein FMN transferase n=1 Tax=Rhizomonospora bruguierae TaxID=1581705 RepID=UPI001BD17ABD|nr:FAD:protein FMN transferase [Micromonospora sp. NBRC 107566]
MMITERTTEPASDLPATLLTDPRAEADRLVVRHRVETTAASFTLCLVAPQYMSRRSAGEALADAVAELRAVDATFSPTRRDSLVSRLRRGEIAVDTYAPLADIVARCAAMRAATDGWFDAWAVPGGFDPSGLVKGWAVDRAAARLSAAGIADYAISGGSDLLVRGNAPGGRPWRVGIRHPEDRKRMVTTLELTDGAIATTGGPDRRDHVVNPHTGATAGDLVAATVTGPELAVADAYATALYAAGAAGLAWFPTPDGYRALVVDRSLRGRANG